VAPPVEPARRLYVPRTQQGDLHSALKRFNVLVAHRRFGKTVFAVNELIDKALVCDKEAPRFAYLAPYYRQAKNVVWDYLKRFTREIEDIKHHESELRCDLPNGARISLFGADFPDRLRGLYFDGIVLDEYAQMEPRVWSEIVRPALVDRLGWAVFIGTPRGRNAFWKLYDRARRDKNWFTAIYRASETGIIGEPELAAARREMSEEEYDQEFECSFEAPQAGSYYGKLMVAADSDRRIRRVPWEPARPVTTAWDLGIGDSTAIWFCQRVGAEVRLIDYFESSGVGLDYYAKALRERPYVYDDHLMPHDAKVKEMGTGRSRLEVLASLGVPTRLLPQLGVDDGIQAVRAMLPRCWFDAEKCARGIEALRNYRRAFDISLGYFRPTPVHDWSSHGADAFRYLAIGLRPEEKPMEPIEYPDGGLV
jgi:phage terminase large subunit